MVLAVVVGAFELSYRRTGHRGTRLAASTQICHPGERGGGSAGRLRVARGRSGAPGPVAEEGDGCPV